MPMIEVTAPAGAIAPDAREELLDELAGRLLHWEGAPDTEFFRANSWIYFNELPEDALYVGGRPGGEARIRVDVTTPEGALSDRRRKELVADATKTILDAAGLEESDALRVFVMCSEIDEGSWGAGGQVVEFAALRAAAAAEKEKAAATAG